MGEEKAPKTKKELTVKANKKGKHVMVTLRVLKIFVYPILRLIKPFRVYGHKKVKDGACIYVSNHYALLDPIYVVSTTSEGVHFVGKKEVFDIPVVGWVAKKCRTICANRDGHDVRAILDCFKCLKNGEKICIYPEGTRNKTSEPLIEFRHGAAAIAIKSKTPVVPIMIYKKPRFFRMTHVLIGEPLELSEYYDRKLSEEEMQQADELLKNELLRLHSEHTEFLASKKKKKKA
jgi:1-acyl-sn-glycerol-3-phosphate acyltransferase